MASNNRDAKFWRHMAALHAAQAVNLRKRAEVEDQDAKNCAERARRAEEAPAPTPEPKPAAPPRAAAGAKQGKPTKRG